MSILERLFAGTPFNQLVEHAQKVHGCVKLIRPLADALIAGDHAEIDRLHHEVSRLEYEADQLKDEIRRNFAAHSKVLLPVDRDDLRKCLSGMDDVADSAEDFAVVLRLRKTKMHPALQEEFLAFVDKVIEVSEKLLNIAEELGVLLETAFSGKEAKRLMEGTKELCELEFQADKLARRFSMHVYAIESELDPVTIMMYDKYCQTLGKAANKAETVGKYLRNMIEHR